MPGNRLTYHHLAVTVLPMNTDTPTPQPTLTGWRAETARWQAHFDAARAAGASVRESARIAEQRMADEAHPRS